MSRGRRPATKRSYVGKWRRFVRFCTHTLPQVYKWRARRYLPATESTVILYRCHLRDEGQVHESSLNPYMAAINQTHEDLGFPRPALGHYTSLLRKGFRDAEGDDFDADHERASRAPVPADVIYAILQLGLTTSEPAVLRMCACIVLCYCWYNRANTGMLVLRRDVTIDDFGILSTSRVKPLPATKPALYIAAQTRALIASKKSYVSSVDGINTQLTTRHPQIITGLYKVRTNRRNVGLPPSSPSGSTAYCPLSSVHRLPVRSGQGTLCALEAPVQASLSALVFTRYLCNRGDSLL